VVFLTAANLFIISSVTYKSVTFMDSVEFCGEVCHTVMAPEFTAYGDSPHSKVECVECHIGPGAPWFVQAKLSGVRQVLAVALDTYQHPIPTPVENLRPSRDTCEQCHWPEKFTGNRIKVITRFSDDEANTPLKTVLLLRIGGGNVNSPGIHSWHIDPGKVTTYIATDERRQEIGWIRVEEENGTVTEFATEGFDLDPESVAEENVRTMDCIDCHNRPTHVFTTPADALDQSMANGLVDSSLPFIKKVGVEVLEEAKGAEGDLDRIAERIRAFYEENYGELSTGSPERIDQAVEGIQAIYNRQVFPEMGVTWGTYPNNIGHERYPGCFRCHDESHSAEGGQAISQDCSLCHTLLAWEEENPEILAQLEIE